MQQSNSNDPFSRESESNIPNFPPQAPAPFETKILPFKFYGKAGEYFGIWIVNILLTLVTATLYAPWAKVRRLRYFYQNTDFAQRRFDFTGDPVKIFYGRLIAIGLWAVFAILGNWDPRFAWVGLVLIYIAIPWLIRCTLSFTARNSKFANSRFYFSGTTGKAYIELIKALLIYIFTLGIFSPVGLWLYYRYTFDHLYAGQLRFKLHATWGNYMGAVYVPVLVLFCVIIVALFSMLPILSSVIGQIYQINDNGTVPDPSVLLPLFMMIFVVYFGLLLIFAPWVQARIFITTWNNVTVGDSQFKTSCKQSVFIWIILSNTVLQIVSLGLLTPWAMVRLYRYKVESLSLQLNDDPDQMLNLLQSAPSAIAEEISDIFDFDISL
ncbi:YjgN family protein [Acinetobacter larvae]|uniref:DUF898 domain-containing protein n=1 Tax=Acinetobacter larvae TaxID=1789224 RepID=A0A1B2M3Q7_9GAMM|nr:YjgN family protein [Acinetobacter larvae]AOA59836.1 hypothetical protein BFG52_02530 [Acinetobacter larvae]